MNIYVDCGFYRGIALGNYLKDGVVDDSWKFYAFEPNEELNLEESIDTLGVPIELIKKAVWIENTTVPFSTYDRDNASSIQGTTAHDNPKTVDVPAIDFSEFVAGLPEDANIYCSMDIEGAEFVVLAKMIADETISKINVLDIEFHHRFMSDYTEDDAAKLISQLESLGVEVRLKVPLI